ncbi:MAG TPA: acyl-CoA dehydrogenase family protein [Noviherbaspirillum sp.]|jgi:acyl-CoA dehydrogenase|uniref:acyl-CoA dehydrogenase family protein n=1 Tax=Noviherbaspirillum sp. TaxID=1926288 RepID=UPI002DDD929D|nr:acyl-CoA dehydrogenase family protein [Noviherbaspirillum sp.]HEV2611915.1 acyl-CoA dehydrogenase family protein [Noviherbaspirillum sp.]
MNDMTDDLIRTTDRIFEDACTKAVRESAEAGKWPAELWQAMEDVGLTRAALPEAAGGVGFEFADAMAVLRRSAYHAAPVPLAETMLAGRMLAAVGLAVPDGPMTIVRTPLRAAGSGATISGSARRVPWGNTCEHAVVITEQDGKTMVGLVKTTGTAQAIEKNLAGEPRVHLDFEAAPLIAAAPLDDAHNRLELEGALYRSVQMAGALERLLAYSLQYANERVQFGRPIGKFQAVQHLLAVLAGHAAASSAAAHAAVEASATAPNELAIAIAKARTGEAAGKGAEIAHQVHAAMGYTREHNLHFSTRRLWSWRDEFGNETYWQTRLGRMVASKGADALWPMLTEI